MSLTDKQKEEYVKHDGIYCPHCDGQNLQGEPFEADAGYASQEVMCMDCNENWTDVYTLSSIEEN
jgi:hypothetical protein